MRTSGTPDGIQPLAQNRHVSQFDEFRRDLRLACKMRADCCIEISSSVVNFRDRLAKPAAIGRRMGIIHRSISLVKGKERGNSPDLITSGPLSQKRTGQVHFCVLLSEPDPVFFGGLPALNSSVPFVWCLVGVNSVLSRTDHQRSGLWLLSIGVAVFAPMKIGSSISRFGALLTPIVASVVSGLGNKVTMLSAPSARRPITSTT
jgi:hypothetical protein